MRIAALFKPRHLNLAPQRSPWFAALATPLALAAAPGELLTAVSNDWYEDAGGYCIFCEYPPSSDAASVAETLMTLLESSRSDQRGGWYCDLIGSSLDPARASESVVWDGEPGNHWDFPRENRLWYRLVVTEEGSAIGYCTFSVQFNAQANGEMPRNAVELEIEEVWLAPRHRDQGIGRALGEQVARLCAMALQEVDARLSRLTSDVISVQLCVSADMYSYSGEKFVCMVGEILRDELMTLVGEYTGTFARLHVADVRSAPNW
jgi:GNAT superfamily N-acetyltransferase